MKVTQRTALSHDETVGGSTIQELSTGSGKTAKGYANLQGLREYYGKGTYFFITPKKTLVDQIAILYPDFHVIYGRNEYECLYYDEPKFMADQVPCSLLDDCAFRVNFETGETHEPGVEPCPYLHAKWKGKNKLVVCTLSFYLFTVLYSDQWGEIHGVVIDEAHDVEDVIRNALSYEVTDYHLERIICFLKDNGMEGANEFQMFLNSMKQSVKRHSTGHSLLDDAEIHTFINLLSKIDRPTLKNELRKFLRRKQVTEEQRETTKKLEMVIRDLHRYITSFEYSIDNDKRKALNYTYAYLNPRRSENQKVEYSLHIKCYNVAPIIAKIFPENKTFVMTATLGNIQVFRMQTGWKYPVFTHDSEFPVENARIYLPSNAEDLSVAHSKKRGKATTIRRIARTCKLFAQAGHRSLVLVVSEDERQQFLRMAAEENIQVVTYGNGVKSKEALQLFKSGAGEVLAGTFAQYGEGIDLPNQNAPVTFALRPGFPPPNDPRAMYEEKRFKDMRWVIWNDREMKRILQARGRNIRNKTDKGVTFCMSSQYKRIVLKSLPKWLLPAYRHSLKFDDCVQDALNLLGTTD